MTVCEASQLRAEIALAHRRTASAEAASEALQSHICNLKAQLDARGGSGSNRAKPSQNEAVARVVNFKESPQLNGVEVELVSKDVGKARCKVRLASGELRQIPLASLDIPSTTATPRSAAPREDREHEVRQDDLASPVLSPSGLMVRSCLSPSAGSLPCEFWPLVKSGIARALLPDELVVRLRDQLAAAAAGATRQENGMPQRVELEADCEFAAVTLELCNLLAWSLLGSGRFQCDLDAVWGVVQHEGEYRTMQSQRNSRSNFGFAVLLDVHLPSVLGADNHDRPAKGAYGYHDGVHSILWKTDQPTDRDNLIQPGILQLELLPGYLYVFPQWLQQYTWPFEGSEQRAWLAASVALTGVDPSPDQMIPPTRPPFGVPKARAAKR